MGSASRQWLHHSLRALNKSLGGKLHIFKGDPFLIFEQLLETNTIKGIFWNRCYEPWRMTRDASLKDQLPIETISFNGSLLWEPWQVLKGDGTPYKVFTPFYRNGCLSSEPPHTPLPSPQTLEFASLEQSPQPVESLGLLSPKPWSSAIMKHWHVGEQASKDKLDQFLEAELSQYKTSRDYPAKLGTSLLSPHLHFGEISPNQVWWAVRQHGSSEDHEHFLSELGWREFSNSQLFHTPTLPSKNYQKKFDAFQWSEDAKTLHCWQKGQTGIPLVDAGMRQLWQTGFMHNRLRMVTGSLLVKNLLQPWQTGERWFWDTLVDADLANNSAGWQWIAGCGADAAPYFRIFNPLTQGTKFDPEGTFTRTYVPELANLPNKYLFNPWTAPEAVLSESGVHLGKTYPKPIVDLQISRQKALEAFQALA